METSRKIAIIIGVLFLIAAVASIAALLMYDPILNNANYIISGSANAQVSWGAVLEIITAFAVMGTSITLYPILKTYNERMALATVCFRLAEALMIMIGILCLLTIITLNVHSGNDPNANTSTYFVIGKVLVAFHDWTMLYGPNVLLGPSTFMTAFILHQTKLVPRFVTILGLTGGPVIFLCGILVTLGLFKQLSMWGALMAIPVFSYEMSLALWLCIKGFAIADAPTSTVEMQNLFRLAADQKRPS